MRPALLALALVVLAAPARADPFDNGWWVVVGSFANPDNSNFQTASVARASAAVRRCGLEPFNDFSMKFSGFREGFDVVVVGGYPDRRTAASALAKLRPCVPNAYVKAARHLGE